MYVKHEQPAKLNDLSWLIVVLPVRTLFSNMDRMQRRSVWGFWKLRGFGVWGVSGCFSGSGYVLWVFSLGLFWNWAGSGWFCSGSVFCLFSVFFGSVLGLFRFGVCSQGLFWNWAVRVSVGLLKDYGSIQHLK